MYPVYRQLRIAIQTITLQRLRNPSSNPTHIHPSNVRSFSSTQRAEATENLNFKQAPLFQQLAANPEALVRRILAVVIRTFS